MFITFQIQKFENIVRINSKDPNTVYILHDSNAVDIRNEILKLSEEDRDLLAYALHSYVRCNPWPLMHIQLQIQMPHLRKPIVSQLGHVTLSWEYQKYTGMIAISDERHRIPCHCNQLTAGSPVFAAMRERWNEDASYIQVHGDSATVQAMLEVFYNEI